MTNKYTDPLEAMLADALPATAIKDGTKGMHGATKHLDFYLPDKDVYIECSAAYTPRKIEQLSRADNIIYVQGKKATEYLSNLIRIAEAVREDMANGFVMAPKEAVADMPVEGVKVMSAAFPNHLDPHTAAVIGQPKEVYKAMIEAAPKSKLSEVVDE